MLIYNTLYNKVVKFTEEFYKKIDFNVPERSSTDVLQFLIDNSFILDGTQENDFLNICEQNFVERISTTQFLTLIPSFKCNFKCPYCYENHVDNNEIKRENYVKIVNNIVNIGIKNIS